MKRNTGIYFLLLLLWWLTDCEFKLPTLPRVPERWNSRLILPLLQQEYSFQDLVYDSLSGRNNPIFADTTSHKLFYFAVDTPGQVLTIAPDYWKIPGADFSKKLDLSRIIDAELNKPVPVYQTVAKGLISKRNNYIVRAALNSDNMRGANSIRVSATLSDTMDNDLDIEIIARNFKDVNTDRLWIDTLHLAADSLNAQISMDVNGDSLFSIDRRSMIDSLEFGLTLMIRDTLRQKLTQNLEIGFEIGELHLASFYGRPIASGYLNGHEILNSPDGADSILFDNANADFTVTNTGAFDSLRIVISGRKMLRTLAETDDAFALSGTSYRCNLAPIMAVLPDSIIFYVEAAQPLAQYDGAAIGGEITVGYQLYAPLKFTLPAELLLSAGHPTRFYITDSLTRSNISRSQNGAQLDITITNRTPFRGSLILLIGNRDVFPMDSADASLYPGYRFINDTLYYIGSDTEQVLIDTLALIDLPASVMETDSVISVGRETQIYFADSRALSVISDTCYFLPKFHLVNPDTNEIFLQSDYKIEIESYLNLLFDAGALNQTATDTSDTTG
ncbi:MAG: hypothetical protein DRP96_03855 [Candidatus Neomarinimicrobiota bacterium]|nr:MAG: hypothetical protein DRP96_03855 [Candidatus Neomarinimicrobiota bacterium]